MPTGFCSLTALCAARTERGRPSVIGNTIAGNSTMPRTGTMIRASAAMAATAPAEVLFRRIRGGVVSHCGLRLLQCDQAGNRWTPIDEWRRSGQREANPAFEAPLRKLETVDGRGLDLRRIGANAGNEQLALIDERFHLAEVHAGQGDEHEHRVLGLENVHRRLPSDGRGRADTAGKIADAFALRAQASRMLPTTSNSAENPSPSRHRLAAPDSNPGRQQSIAQFPLQFIPPRGP